MISFAELRVRCNSMSGWMWLGLARQVQVRASKDKQAGEAKRLRLRSRDCCRSRYNAIWRLFLGRGISDLPEQLMADRA